MPDKHNKQATLDALRKLQAIVQRRQKVEPTMVDELIAERRLESEQDKEADGK